MEPAADHFSSGPPEARGPVGPTALSAPGHTGGPVKRRGGAEDLRRLSDGTIQPRALEKWKKIDEGAAKEEAIGATVPRPRHPAPVRPAIG